MFSRGELRLRCLVYCAKLRRFTTSVIATEFYHPDMSILYRQRQLVYGTIFGVCTFLAGWITIHPLMPAEILSGLPRWKATLWVFLSAHFMSVSGLQIGGLGAAFTDVDLIAQFPTLRGFRALPILFTMLGGLLMVEVVNYTKRLTYLLQNAAALLIGYLGSGVLTFIISDMQPGASLMVFLGVLIAGATVVGSKVTQRLTGNLPILGVTSVGSIVLVGLLVIFGGLTVLQAIGPFIGVSTVGVVFAGGLAWIARNVPT